MNSKIFRAYDIRGKYPSEINEKAVEKIIEGLAKNFFKPGKVIVGHDARLSSPELYRAAIRSIKYPAFAKASADRQVSNIKIIKGGLMTTPMLSFLVNKLKADGGIMITASHNPKEYNGLKIVGAKAVPMSGKEILFKMQNVKIKNQNDKSKC